jgi:hypothetical protein
MGAYLVRRFGLMLLTLFGISLIIFVLLQARAGQYRRYPVRQRRHGETRRTRRALSRNSGSIARLPMQYAAWIGGMLQGDLGFSYVSEKSAWSEIAPRIPVSGAARGDGAAVRDRDRRAARGDQRGQAEFGARLCAAGDEPVPACPSRRSGSACSC